MRRLSFREISESIFLGLGILLLLSPVGLYWFIHGDDERYQWIIRGPAPFNSFGGGPYQLGMYVGLVLIGTCCIVAAVTIKGVRK